MLHGVVILSGSLLVYVSVLSPWVGNLTRWYMPYNTKVKLPYCLVPSNCWVDKNLDLTNLWENIKPQLVFISFWVTFLTNQIVRKSFWLYLSLFYKSSLYFSGWQWPTALAFVFVCVKPICSSIASWLAYKLFMNCSWLAHAFY